MSKNRTKRNEFITGVINFQCRVYLTVLPDKRRALPLNNKKTTELKMFFETFTKDITFVRWLYSSTLICVQYLCSCVM